MPVSNAVLKPSAWGCRRLAAVPAGPGCPSKGRIARTARRSSSGRGRGSGARFSQRPTAAGAASSWSSAASAGSQRLLQPFQPSSPARIRPTGLRRPIQPPWHPVAAWRWPVTGCQSTGGQHLPLDASAAAALPFTSRRGASFATANLLSTACSTNQRLQGLDGRFSREQQATAEARSREPAPSLPTWRRPCTPPPAHRISAGGRRLAKPSAAGKPLARPPAAGAAGAPQG